MLAIASANFVLPTLPKTTPPGGATFCGKVLGVDA